MGYDREKRNLRQRADRFLRKYGIARTDGKYVLPDSKEHDRTLFGVAQLGSRPTCLGESPVDAVIALQGLSLLALHAFPEADEVLERLASSPSREQVVLLRQIGLTRNWLLGWQRELTPNSGFIVNGRQLTGLLELFAAAETRKELEREIVEQYMYLR